MNSCATTERVYQNPGLVMVLLIVLVVQMKMKPSVPRVPSSSSAQMAGAQTWRMFVTERIIVEITAMKIKFVLVSMKTWFKDLRHNFIQVDDGRLKLLFFFHNR